MTVQRVICIGGGGHALVAIDTLQSMAATIPLEVVGFTAKTATEARILGVPFLATDDDLPAVIASTKASHFLVGLGTIRGGNALRPNLFLRMQSLGLTPFTAIHPSAIISRSAEIGDGTALMAGAVVQPGVRVGRNAIINTGARIDHGCTIGDDVHIAPGAVLSGDVTIGANAFVGAGAVVVQGVVVGDGATIGAGAVVLRDCDAGAIYVGSPARRLG